MGRFTSLMILWAGLGLALAATVSGCWEESSDPEEALASTTEAAVQPQLQVGVVTTDYQDQECLNNCLLDCGIECGGGPGKSACIRRCMQHNNECEQICEVPGEPPTRGGGGGSECPVRCSDGSSCCNTNFPVCGPTESKLCCMADWHAERIPIFGGWTCLPNL